MADRPDYSPVEERVTTPSQPAMITDLPPGLILINQFRVEEKLGGGGMGTVYRCLELTVQRTVAIKVLHPHLVGMSKWLLRFQQEARSLARLDHPNIVGVKQMVSQDGMPFIVMDYIKGPNLGDILSIMGMLSPARTAKIMSQVADALAHAHANGVVHRDLKPGNIIIVEGSDDLVKVLDFGIAKISDSDEPTPAVKLTQTGEVFGSPAYMSPEQVMGKDIDGRSDQYSFGCMLYECLTGTPPFVSTSPVEIMMQHVNNAPIPLAQASLGKEFPFELEHLTMRLLAKDPQDRYQSMLQVKNALNRAVAPEDNLFVPEDPQLDQRFAPVKQQKKFPLVPCVLAVLACAVSALIGYVVCSFNQKPEKTLVQQLAPTEEQETKLSDAQKDEEGVCYSKRILPNGDTEFDFGPEKLGRLSYSLNYGPETQRHIYKTVVVPKGMRMTAEISAKTLINHPKVLEVFRNTKLTSLDIGIEGFDNVVSCSSDERYAGDTDALQRACIFIQPLKNIDTLAFQSVNLQLLGLQILDINNLPKLSYLRVAKTPVDGKEFAKLRGLKRLNTLDITSMPHSIYVLRSLQESINIWSLVLRDCGISDKEMQLVGRFPSLVLVDCANSPKVTAKALRYLSATHMQNITASGTSIGPESLPTLAKFTSLNSLTLPKQLWPPSSREKLRQGLPKVTIKFE